MAHDKVTGKPKEWFEEKRKDHKPVNQHDYFEDQYCMAKIPRQPDDYDGPTRYCAIPKEWLYKVGDSKRCKFHGGKVEPNPQNLEKLAAMKHGMNALRQHVVQDFSEKDRALYDWIVESFSENYDIDVENDPNAAYDLHRYAAEAVRAERGRGHLLEEGEVHETEKVSDEGNVVVDEDGEIVTEKSEHYLAKMMDRQDKKLTKLAKALGITRQDRLRRDQTDDAVEAITKGFSELGSAFLQRDEQDYDPDSTPWEGDDEDTDNES